MHDVLFEKLSQALDDDSLRGYAEKLGLDMTKYDDCFRSDASIDRIGADFKQGIAFGVAGTPRFFINGHILLGAYPAKDFLKLIDEAEAEAKSSGIARKNYYKTLEERGCSN
jgi:protein-disulfide isomerase